MPFLRTPMSAKPPRLVSWTNCAARWSRRSSSANVQVSDDFTKEIQDLVRTRLSQHEYPRHVAVVRELPKTPAGKINRKVLREREPSGRFRYLELLQRDRHDDYSDGQRISQDHR